MDHNDQPWILPLKDLFDETGALRPLAILRIERSIEKLDEYIEETSQRAPNEQDAIWFALAIADLAVHDRWLEHILEPLNSALANLTQAERQKKEEKDDIKNIRRMVSLYYQHCDRLVYGYALASGSRSGRLGMNQEGSFSPGFRQTPRSFDVRSRHPGCAQCR